MRGGGNDGERFVISCTWSCIEKWGYRNRGCGVNDSGSASSSRRTSDGSYERSSPHSSQRTKKGSLTGRGSNASVSPRGILCPNIMFVSRCTLAFLQITTRQ